MEPQFPTPTKNYVDNSRLKAAAVLALNPLFGPFGIHDFFAKRGPKGLTHLVICILQLIVTPFALFIGVMGADAGPNILSYIIVSEPFVAIFLLYVWGVVEGLQFLIVVRDRIKNMPTIADPEREKLKRRNLDWIIVYSTIAALIIVPALIGGIMFYISAIK